MTIRNDQTQAREAARRGDGTFGEQHRPEPAGLNPLTSDQPTKTTTASGAQEWRLPTGELHRDDGPAVTSPDGSEAWYQHGKLHRDDGPAYTSPDGSEFWYQHSQCHRDDGPAVAYSDGDEYWYQRGKLHRVGGPAIARTDGTEEWWINGTQVTEFEHAVVARAHTITEQGHTPELPQSSPT